jgi:hypothetical protein
VNLKSTALILAVAILAAGVSYQMGTSYYKNELSIKRQRILDLESSIEEALLLQTPPPTKRPPSEDDSDFEGELDCSICHEPNQTKGFHVPQTIMKIDVESGKRRRVCIDCHGPLGPPWSADEQLTSFSDIKYNASVGANGIIEVPNKVPHSVHKQKLESGAIRCQTCHGNGKEIIIPKADTSKGQVLVCQNCKFHPEEGNYITIHLEIAGKKCTTCHTGSIIEVHKAKTNALGQI